MQVDFSFSWSEYKNVAFALMDGKNPCSGIECDGQFCVNCPLNQFFKKQFPDRVALDKGFDYVRTHVRSKEK